MVVCNLRSALRSGALYIFQRYKLLMLCFISCGVLVLYYSQFQLMNRISPQILDGDSVTKFLIDTIGCRIPVLDPWDKSVRHLINKISNPYKCPGKPSFLKTLSNGVVSIDKTLLQYYYEIDSRKVSCVYQQILRNTSVIPVNTSDVDMDKRFYMGSLKNLSFDQPMDIDFIKTSCSIGDGSRKFVEFIPLTPLKADVEERCVRKNSNIKVSKPLNVLFLGLDSISHLNYMRHFPKSNEYLSKVLNAITLHGYTKLGDNTFPNLVPLLTGYFYHHYYNDTNKNMYFDDLDFSWKHFSELGYRTLFAEDAPNIAVFNYVKNGFKIAPTNYYYRPFALAVEKSELSAKSKYHCFGSKMEMEFLYDYLKSFTNTMGRNRPFYAFLFLSRLTHDLLNFAGYADEPTYQLLKYLHESNTLNNTMLVFYSDHGIRFGGIRKTRIGQYEERMPFMHFIFPKWFLNEHKDIYKNLKINSYRLTTPFDIHATVKHLASLMSGEKKFEYNLKPGISLFREIPSNRTCPDAQIPPHWCTCPASKTISKQDSIVQKAAKILIETVNKMTKAFKSCAILTLHEILDARVTDSGNYLNKKGNSAFKYYVIVISVEPSKAVFEATVSCATTEGSPCDIPGDISRINKYGNQSHCVSEAVLKKVCYCL